MRALLGGQGFLVSASVTDLEYIRSNGNYANTSFFIKIVQFNLQVRGPFRRKNRLASSGTSSSVDPESVSVKSDSDAIDSSDV